MSKRVRFLSISAALILAWAIPSAAQTALQPSMPSGIRVDLELAQAQVADSRVVNVTVTYTNRGAETQSFLKRHSPFADPLDGVAFSVTRDGAAIRYLGYMVSYGPIGAGDFIVLGPGQSRSVTVNLGEVYDLSVPGDYQVQIRSAVRGVRGAVSSDLDAARGTWSGRLESRAVEFAIASSASRQFISLEALERKSVSDLEPNTGGTTCTGCTPEEEAAVNESMDKACVMANDARAAAAAAADEGGNINYEEWFGEFNVGRAVTINANWNATAGGFCGEKKNEIIAHGAACQINWLAYIIVGQDNKIYLCDGWWNTPAFGGTYSRAGTLVHEMSHLKALTEDHAYGPTNCRDLAINSPALAIDNADNYRFYAQDINSKLKAPGLSPQGGAALFAFLALSGAAVLVRRRRSLEA